MRRNRAPVASVLRLAIGLGAVASVPAITGGCGEDEGSGSGGSGGATSSSDVGSGGQDHAYIELPKRSGTVTVFESHIEGVRETNLVGAFLDIVDGYAGACAEETFGGCTVTFCKSGSVGRDALIDAGSLTLKFGEEAVPVVTERNVATGFYLATVVDDELLATGVDVTISTTGSQVPSFASTVRSPPTAMLTSALPPEGGRISTSAPFDLAWTADDDDDGELVFALRAVAARENRTLECAFEVAGGAGRVPVEALAALAALPATETVALEVETRTRTTATAGDFTISLALVVTALSGEVDGVRAIGGFDP